MRYIEGNDEDNDALTIQETPPKAYLALLVEGRISHTFPLRGEVQLGREKGNAIVVADQKVSRRHAILRPIENTFIIQDQGSANGTYVNGVLIAQPTRLQNNDKIRIGDASFLFTTSESGLTAVERFTPPVASPLPAPPLAIPPQAPILTDNTRPIWIVIGCMAMAIIALLIILALMLGLFVGRTQVGLALFWLVQAAGWF